MKKLVCVMSVFVMVLCTVLHANAEKPEVSAKGCVLIEEKTGAVIFSENADKKLPMASTTKIMTSLLCLESGDLDSEFVVDADAIRVEGSSMGLKEGDIVTKRALCCGMLLPSGNDAANAAAVKLAGSIPEFAKLMNARAEKIGMTRTCFVTPSGLGGEGHGASALDMALLAREALKNPDFCEICSQPSMKVRFGDPPYERRLKNTNKLLTMYKGTKGVKTGFTDEAGRCLVSACERNGVSLICVTLNDRNDWNDHMRLYDYGFAQLSSESLSNDESFDVSAAGGTKDSLKAKAEGSIAIGSSADIQKNITEKILLPPFVYADVKSGDKVGEVRYYYEERLIGSLDIKACEDISYKEEKKTFTDKIKEFLFG